MIADIKLSPKQLNDKISLFARLYGFTVAQVFYAQGALLCQWLATRMFPRTEVAGKNTVRRDLIGDFGMIPKNMRTWESNGRQYFKPRKKDDPRRPFSIKLEMYNPSGDLSRMINHHRRFQNATSGQRIVVHWQDGRMFVPDSKRNQYIRRIQQHVGRTKSAWLVGMRYCLPRAGTGLVKSSTLKPFILRHDDFSKRYGRVFDGVKAIKLLTGGTYAIWLGNDVPWVDKKDSRALLESGVKTRRRDLLYGMWKRMPDAGARAGFKVKVA